MMQRSSSSHDWSESLRRKPYSAPPPRATYSLFYLSPTILAAGFDLPLEA